VFDIILTEYGLKLSLGSLFLVEFAVILYGQSIGL